MEIVWRILGLRSEVCEHALRVFRNCLLVRCCFLYYDNKVGVGSVVGNDNYSV